MSTSRVRYSPRVSGGGRRSGGGPGLLGAVVVVVVVVVLILVALLVGGLVLVGFGVYIGVLTYRSRALAVADSPTIPIPVHGSATAATAPAPVRKFFGLDPSYGLSATCIGVGVLMFIGGVALLSNSDKPPSQTGSPTYASTAPVILPTTTPLATPGQPGFVAPELDSTSTPTTTAVQPSSATGLVEVPTAKVEVPTEKAAPPQPASPEQPAAGDEGDAVYYKNCDAARAAGAAPIHKGEPGYRPALDRDHDGIACDQ